MQARRLNIILLIIIILLVGIIGNFIKKDYLNNEKVILKSMTETEYENYITELNQSHEDYANYIEESKKQIANAITDMGVTTSYEDTLENMANNIRSIVKSSGSITTIELVFIGGYDSRYGSSNFAFDVKDYTKMTIIHKNEYTTSTLESLTNMPSSGSYETISTLCSFLASNINTDIIVDLADVNYVRFNCPTKGWNSYTITLE